MDLLTLAEEAELHQGVYRAALESVLAATGSKMALARSVGITPQYLSYILAGQRSPGSELAERIVREMPLEASQRTELLEHIHLAKERDLERQHRRESVRPDRDVPNLVLQMGSAHHEATFRATPARALKLYQIVKTAASELFETTSPRLWPNDYIELCFLLHDVNSVLNNHYDALYYARRAYSLIISLRNYLSGDIRRLISDRLEHSLRAQSTSYRNLGLYKEAYLCCLKAIDIHKPIKNNNSIFIYGETLRSIRGVPRFALTEAENISDHIYRMCDSIGDGFAPLWLFSADYNLGRAYIAHGNIKKAKRVVSPYRERLEQVPALGPIHLVNFLETHARIQHLIGDKEAWKLNIGQALFVAHQAGLGHQIAKIKAQYGSEVYGIIEEVRHH